jgi:OOP family OmpA-OmpF porin
MLRTAALGSILCLSLACAGTPRKEPLPMKPLQAGSGERVIVDHAVLLVDTSRSICEECQFPDEKALLESFVAGMPNGGYSAGSVVFGGYERQIHAIAPFERGGLAKSARDTLYLGEGTPVDRVLDELAVHLAGKGKRAAVVLLSDGLATDPVGREIAESRSLSAAQTLAAVYEGPVCFHTVQVGDDPTGAAFLEKLSKVTDCGSARTLAATNSAAAVDRFERQVFLGAAPTPKPRAVAPVDTDQDGVADEVDRCPQTPLGAKADERGCWSISWLKFATDSAAIRPADQQRLTDEILPLLREKSSLRIRIDGYTDSRGSEAYNQALSERRAKSVRDFLVAQGIDGSRLESRGFGETNPIAPNDTPANLQRNRRTELTVL